MVYQPIPPRGLTTAAPYSYREGLTFQQKLERILAMLQTVIFDNGALAESYNAIIKEANASIQTALDSIEGLSERYDGQLVLMDEKFQKQLADVDKKLGKLQEAIDAANSANDTASAISESVSSAIAKFRTDIDGYDARITVLADNVMYRNTLFFNVKDYGAKGDGQTDDTSAINAACSAAGIGGIVFFPKGTYLVSGEVKSILDQKWWAAGGLDNSTPGTTVRFVNESAVVNAFSCQFDGIRFDGPGAEKMNSRAINAKGAAYLSNCVFYDFDTALYANQAWYLNVTHSYFRYNSRAIQLDWCYNVTLVDIRVHCRKRDSSYGVGIDLVNGSMATCHGGSIEMYSTGVNVNAHGAFTMFGVYMETKYPDASGVRLNGPGSVVAAYGCQVYPQYHKGWIDAGAGDAGSSIVGIGNKFKGSENQTNKATAYYWGSGNTKMLTVTLLGDTWTDVTGSGYQYTNTDPLMESGSIIQYPVGSVPGRTGAKVSFNSMVEMTNNRTFVLGNTGLPAAAPKGGMVYDPQTGKPMFGDGTRWRDAMGN